MTFAPPQGRLVQTLYQDLAEATGAAYAARLRYLLLTERNGNLSRLDLIHPPGQTQQRSGVIREGQGVRLISGPPGNDIILDRISPDKRLVLRPQGNAGLAYLGQVDFDALTYVNLARLDYPGRTASGDLLLLRAEPDAENQLVQGAVFAVFNGFPQPAATFDFAKVQVVSTADGITLRWVTWVFDTRYRIVGTGYQEPVSVALSGDERFAYVGERGGQLLGVDLAEPSRAGASVITSGLSEVAQIVLAEEQGMAYVVEGGPQGRLARVGLRDGRIERVAEGLSSPRGLLLTHDRRTAYVTEFSADTTSGRISRISLATGARATVATIADEPSYLAWADLEEQGLLVAERHSRRLLRVALAVSQEPSATAGWTWEEASGIALMEPGWALVTGQRTIWRVRLPFPDDSPSIGALKPDTVVAGTTRLELTIYGSGYVEGGSEVYWNGARLPTRFISANKLIALVDGALMLTPQEVRIAVSNGGQPLRASDAFRFTISKPTDDVALLRQQLEQTRQSLLATQRQLQQAQEQVAQLRSTNEGLQRQGAGLSSQLDEFRHRLTTRSTSFGATIGQTVEAIQQGLQQVEDASLSYVVQRFDVQAQANLQIADDGTLDIRLPGVNEQIASHSLSTVQIRVGPVLKRMRPRSDPTNLVRNPFFSEIGPQGTRTYTDKASVLTPTAAAFWDASIGSTGSVATELVVGEGAGNVPPLLRGDVTGIGNGIVQLLGIDEPGVLRPEAQLLLQVQHGEVAVGLGSPDELRVDAAWTASALWTVLRVQQEAKPARALRVFALTDRATFYLVFASVRSRT